MGDSTSPKPPSNLMGDSQSPIPPATDTSPPAADTAGAAQDTRGAGPDRVCARSTLPGMLSVEEAQREILGRVRVLPSERVDVLAALGRVLAEPIRSTRRIPPWPNSSMDGYAVRAADARPSATLRVVDRVIAGSLPTRAVGTGEAMRIFTGAPLPDGADAVVPQEDVDARDGMIALRSTVVPGAFVRPAGEDVREGDLVLEPGRPIGAAEIGILATLGRTQVTVGRRPRVAVLSTGNELADLGTEPTAAQIPNSNTYSLMAQVMEIGGLPLNLGVAPDRLDAIAERIARGTEADMLVSSAGVSVGELDLVREALVDRKSTRLNSSHSSISYAV